MAHQRHSASRFGLHAQSLLLKNLPRLSLSLSFSFSLSRGGKDQFSTGGAGQTEAKRSTRHDVYASITRFFPLRDSISFPPRCWQREHGLPRGERGTRRKKKEKGKKR